MLFSDAALREIADRQPVVREQLLEVKGVGNAKAGKYGSDVIAIVRKHRGEAAQPEDNGIDRNDSSLIYSNDKPNKSSKPTAAASTLLAKWPG